MSETVLKGMTWDHARGYDPLAACSAQWFEREGVRIEWDRRSLQDFESFPVQALARQYDLIVIDHPHVGQITREDCLLPLDGAGHDEALAELARHSVGPSFESYRWQDRQWALPLDAATQVQAWVPGRLERPVGDWDEMMALARQGKVHCPLRAPHSLMSLYTLAGHLDRAPDASGPGLFDPVRHAPAYDRLLALYRHLPDDCLHADPIAVFEQMTQAGSSIACAPLIYGYVNYAIAGFRPARLAFADFPTIGARAPRGSALGGTGIAVSAYSAASAQAVAFAFWVAGAQAQCGPYVAAGGQAGHASAWEDEAANAATLDFYRATRATLEGAWLRPRHDGYMVFQESASLRLNAALAAGEDARTALEALNGLYTHSLAAAAP